MRPCTTHPGPELQLFLLPVQWLEILHLLESGLRNLPSKWALEKKP